MYIYNRVLKARRLVIRKLFKLFDRQNYKERSEFWPWVSVQYMGHGLHRLTSLSKKHFVLGSPSHIEKNSTSIAIIGSGPSIKDVDFGKLDKSIDLILLNGAIGLAKRHSLNPLCCIIIDSTFVENRFEIVKNMPAGTRLVTTIGCLRAIYERDKKILDNISIFLTRNINSQFYMNAKIGEIDHFLNNGFSDDLNAGYVDGGTVMSVGIQMAFQLNAKDIFLFGFDIGNAHEPRFDENNKNKQKSGLLKDYELKIFPFMNKVKELAYQKNIKVNNCSKITKLPYDVIPYLSHEVLYIQK